MSRRRLSPLSLPSLTTLLFALQALVIVGAGLASLLPFSQLWWGLIAPALILLPLRDFLHGPEREAKRWGMQPAGETEAAVQEQIEEISQEAGLHPPQLLVGQRPTPIYSFGAFRRAFIALGVDTRKQLVEWATSPDPGAQSTFRVLLAHELAHFANRDLQLAGLARSLLKVTALYTLFGLWVSTTLVSVLVAMGPEITQDAFWQGLARTVPIPGFDLSWAPTMLQAKNPYAWKLLADPANNPAWSYALLYLTNVFFPFVLAVPILYLFFWRKLMRVREFYADAYAASVTGNPEDVSDAVALTRTLTAWAPSPGGRLAQFRQLIARPFLWLGNLKPLRTWPEPTERAAALANPLSIFGPPWQIALWTGVAVLLLEIILRSSLTLIYISQPGPHLPLLTASIIFSLWLLPRLCTGASLPSLWRPIASLSLIFILAKLTMTFLDAILILAAMLSGRLGAVGAITDHYLRSQLGFGGLTSGPIFGDAFGWPQLIDGHIIRPIAYFGSFGLALLILFLLTDAWLRQRALTWYRLGERVKRVFWLQLAALALIEVLVLIPLANRLFFPMIYTWASPWFYAGLLVGLLLTMVAAALFLVYHRRLAGRCPGCQGQVNGPFALGKTCPHCGATLHPWLLAPY